MPMINGKSYGGGGSITKALARHRLSEGKKGPGEKVAEKAHEVATAGSKSESHHDGEEGSHEEIQKVAAEHGPATKVTVEHDGQNHTVHTTHKDGHNHSSHGHPSPQHVADHISAASGAGEEQPGMEESSMGSEGESSSMPFMSEGMSGEQE